MFITYGEKKKKKNPVIPKRIFLGRKKNVCKMRVKI